MINKIDKPLTRLIKEKRKRTQINKIRNKRQVTTNTTEIQRIVRNYYEQLHAKKLDNLDEIDKFLETYNPPKLNQEEAESLNRPTTTSDFAAVIKNLLEHKSPGLDSFQANFTKYSKKHLLPSF